MKKKIITLLLLLVPALLLSDYALADSWVFTRKGSDGENHDYRLPISAGLLQSNTDGTVSVVAGGGGTAAHSATLNIGRRSDSSPLSEYLFFYMNGSSFGAKAYSDTTQSLDDVFDNSYTFFDTNGNANIANVAIYANYANLSTAGFSDFFFGLATQSGDSSVFLCTNGNGSGLTGTATKFAAARVALVSGSTAFTMSGTNYYPHVLSGTLTFTITP